MRKTSLCHTVSIGITKITLRAYRTILGFGGDLRSLPLDNTADSLQQSSWTAISTKRAATNLKLLFKNRYKGLRKIIRIVAIRSHILIAQNSISAGAPPRTLLRGTPPDSQAAI